MDLPGTFWYLQGLLTAPVSRSATPGWDHAWGGVQECKELRLPVDTGEVQDAIAAAYKGAGPWRGEAELLLELRASLSSAASWAPMVATLLIQRT